MFEVPIINESYELQSTMSLNSVLNPSEAIGDSNIATTIIVYKLNN